MDGCLIYNPSAGSAEKLGALGDVLEGIELRETRAPGDAQKLAQAACGSAQRVVIAGGGDGTINQVVNGLMSRKDRPVLGVLPLGTGNDFARTIGMPLDDPHRALEIIREGCTRMFDVVRMKMSGVTRWYINVAAGGFTGQMNEVMTDELKQTWGPLAYMRGALKVIPDLTHYRTTIRLGTQPAREVAALNIIIANGRTAGGGTEVAPLANPEDGYLDLVVVKSGTMLELTGVAARLLAGNYLNSDIVAHRRAKRVAIESSPGMWFNVDGELIGNEPATFQVVPGALRVIVGPDYQAVPAARAGQAESPT